MNKDQTSKKPTSQRRIDANRANAKKSTGPKTPTGKAKSAANSLRHGFCSKGAIVSVESFDEYNDLRSLYMTRLGARDEVEINLIDRMVHATWNQQRAWSIENALIDKQILLMTSTLEQQYTDIPPDSRLAFAIEALAKEPALPLIQRYEARLATQFLRAMKTLLELREKFPVPLAPDPGVSETLAALPTGDLDEPVEGLAEPTADLEEPITDSEQTGALQTAPEAPSSEQPLRPAKAKPTARRRTNPKRPPAPIAIATASPGSRALMSTALHTDYAAQEMKSTLPD